MAPLDRTYRLNARLDFENNASAEIATVSAELTVLHERIESLDDTININVDIDTRTADAKIDALKAKLTGVEDASARLDVNSRPAHDKIDNVERRLIAFAARTYRATMDVNVNGMEKLAALQAAIRAIPNSRRSTINVDTDSGVASLRRLTGSMSQAAGGGSFLASVMGSRVFGVSMGLMIALVLAALPLLAPLAAGLMTIAGAAGAVAIGGGLVAGAIARMVQGIKAGEAGFEGISAALARFRSTASAAFLPAALAAARLSTQLVNMGTNYLPRLGVAATNTVNAISRGFNQALAQINRTNTTTNSLNRILARTPAIMGQLTRAGTLFGAGMVNVFRAMLPGINAFARGVRSVAQRFFEWSQTDAARARIQAFMRSAAPVAQALGRAIMRVGSALIDLGIRHGPTAARGIDLLGRALTSVIRAVSLVLDVVRFLATQFARLPAPVRSFATGALFAASAAMALYNAFRLLRIALVGLAVFSGPAGWIVLGLIAVGAALYAAYQHSETFRNAIQRMVNFFNANWPTLVDTARWVSDLIIAAVASIWTVAGPYFWQIVAIAQQAWAAILAATAEYWPGIRDWVLNAATEVTAWFQANWPYILTIVDWVLWAVMGAVGGFAAFWGGAWEGIKMILHGAATIIGSLLEGIVKFVGNMVELVGAILQGDWAGAWEAAKALVSDGMWAMVGVIQGAAEVAIGVIRVMAEGLVSWFQWAYNSIVGNSIVPDLVRDVLDEFDKMEEGSDRRADRWATNVIKQMRRVQDNPIKLANIDASEWDRIGSQSETLMAPAATTPALANPQLGGNKELDTMRDDFRESFVDISKIGRTEMEKMHEVVVDETKLMRRGMKDETEDLFRDMDKLFKSTYESGQENFTLLRQMGIEQTAILNTEASRNMDYASKNMIRSLTEAQTTGNAQLTTLRTHGAATMEAADYEFRYPIGESASGIQSYLNDMLYGMQQVIEAASLNLTPPEEFQIRLTGAAEGGILGDWESLNAMMGDGKVAWDNGMGGVSRPGMSNLHWWGEGENANSTEYYIVHGKEDNLPILEAAAQSLNKTLHDEGEHNHPVQFEDGGVALRQFQYGATMYEDMWTPRTAQIARQTEAATGAVPNTYANHPPGYEYRAPYSVDWWGGGGRGDGISTGLGDQVVSYILSNFASELSYYIWNYMDSWGGSVAAYEPHTDHVHGTFMGAGTEGPGGSGGFSFVDIAKLVAENFPTEYASDGSLPGDVAEAIGSQTRQAMIDVMKSAQGSWDGSGSLRDWIIQGIEFGNVFTADEGTISSLESRAMQESTGDPNAQNNWDSNAAAGTPSKGLFQIIGPTWEAHRSMYGADAGDFEGNWNNPILSTGVATRYMQNVYGGPVGSTGYGYTEGGIATAMQMALVAEKGPELFIPLHDTRAVQLLFDQIVDWRGAKDLDTPTMDVVQRFESENAVVNARMTANTGTESNRVEIRRLGDRLESALSRQVDAKITNVEEMVDVAVQAAVGAQESPAGQSIQARNRAREYEHILNRRK